MLFCLRQTYCELLFQWKSTFAKYGGIAPLTIDPSALFLNVVTLCDLNDLCDQIHFPEKIQKFYLIHAPRVTRRWRGHLSIPWWRCWHVGIARGWWGHIFRVARGWGIRFPWPRLLNLQLLLNYKYSLKYTADDMNQLSP